MQSSESLALGSATDVEAMNAKTMKAKRILLEAPLDGIIV